MRLRRKGILPKITIELSSQQHVDFVNAKMRLKEKSLQSLMIRATSLFLSGVAGSAAPSAPPDYSMQSSPLADLTAKEIRDMSDLAEILRDPPRGSIFKSLKNTVELSLDEFRKERPAKKAARQGDDHQRRKTRA